MQHPKIFKFKHNGEQIRLLSKMIEADRLKSKWSFGRQKLSWLSEIHRFGYAVKSDGTYVTLLYDYSPRKMDIEFAEIVNVKPA